MTGPELRSKLHDLGFTQREFASATGYSTTAISLIVNSTEQVSDKVYVFARLYEEHPFMLRRIADELETRDD